MTTRKIIEEIEAILKASSDVDFASTGALEPLASESNQKAVYISLEEVAVESVRLNTNSSAYDRHMLISLYCNYDGSEDPLGVYDFIDGVEKSMLSDSAIWSSIVDRDIVAIDYDNQEHTPKRAITMLFDFTYRLTC